MRPDTTILVNPTGRFVKEALWLTQGSPAERLLLIHTVAGCLTAGCFSGKDPTKVDRSGAYMTRYAAKNIVAAGLAEKCMIQIAYAIGVAEPVSLMVDTFGTGKISDEALTDLIERHFDFRPAAIIRDLDLRKPQYRRLAAYGHMGRIDLDPLPQWERTDRADALARDAKGCK